MPLDQRGEIEQLSGRRGTQRTLTNGFEDISGGVERLVSDVTSFSVYIRTKDAVEVTVEVSPDGGETWVAPNEDTNPVAFSGADGDIVDIEYNANRVRLTANNSTNVDATLREVV